MTDHFSEDDARRIFARAAERQGTGDAAPDGLSLQELEAIGQASGIDPAHIAAAAAELRTGVAPPARDSVFGLPRRIEAMRVLPGPVSDDAWARIVDDLRTTFNTTGALSDIGETREWAAGHLSGRDGTRFTMRPRPGGGTEVIARHSLESNILSLKLIGSVGVVAAAMVVGVAFISGDASFLAFSLAVSLLVAVAVAIPIWGLRRSALRAENQFEGLLDRADLAARRDAQAPTASVTSEHAHAEPRLDLGENISDDPTPSRRRRRTR